MARRPARDLTVGAVFALALIILALAVMAVGGDSGLWFKRSEYRTVFPDATGLLLGAPVRMAGVQIGTVHAIQLPTDPGEAGIEVRLAVDPAYAGRVRTDSRSALRILQFLTNEKYVEIVPGSPNEEVLEPGSTIPLLIEVGVVERGEAIADSLTEITAALKNILGPLERGEGLIGRMLQDPEFGTHGVDSLGSALVNIDRLTEDLTAGRGALGRLLYDEALAAKLDTFSTAIDDLSTIVHDLSAKQGALGDLLEEGGSAQLAMADLRETAGSLRRITARLETDEGLLGRLLHDPQYSTDLATELETTLENVSQITEKLNSSEGTLGALVNDRELYDGAQDVVAGVNDSKFARWLLRRYRKKGIKAREAGSVPAGGSVDPEP